MSDVQEALLDLRGVTKRFGGITAVNEVSFQVQAGQIVGLVGPNGPGKTTLMNVISGFEHPTSGRIVFDRSDVSNKKADRLARLGLVRTFQHAHVFDSATVEEAILAGSHIEDHADRMLSFRGLVPRRGSRRAEIAPDLMDRLRLTRWASEKSEALPYGLKKRLGMAVALAAQPQLLLMDEPAAGLNSKETSELTDDILALRDSGVTVVVVEHNMPLIMTVSDRVVVLHHGAKMAEGTPEEVAQNEEVVGAYLGRR